ncbi:hypothetical protein Tco_0012364 [Tanacetum coccineum]
MNDSASGMSDLDMDDIEMILQQLKYEQEQEQAVESSHRHNYIYRERGDAEERLMADYFGAHPKYPSYYFRKLYRMSRKLFLEIVAGIENYIQTVGPLPPHFNFFRVRWVNQLIKEETRVLNSAAIARYSGAIARGVASTLRNRPRRRL